MVAPLLKYRKAYLRLPLPLLLDIILLSYTSNIVAWSLQLTCWLWTGGPS